MKILTKPISTVVNESTFKKIESLRINDKIKTRAKVVRELVLIGLDVKLNENKK